MTVPPVSRELSRGSQLDVRRVVERVEPTPLDVLDVLPWEGSGLTAQQVRDVLGLPSVWRARVGLEFLEERGRARRRSVPRHAGRSSVARWFRAIPFDIPAGPEEGS